MYLFLHKYDKSSSLCTAPVDGYLCTQGCFSMLLQWLLSPCFFFNHVSWHRWQQLKDLDCGYSIAKGCLRMPATLKS